MTSKMEEMLTFPLIYTFKAMGENSDDFVGGVKSVFESKLIHDFKEIKSSKGTYTSVSVTVEVNTYDELHNIYTQIKEVKGLKYHL